MCVKRAGTNEAINDKNSCILASLPHRPIKLRELNATQTN